MAEKEQSENPSLWKSVFDSENPEIPTRVFATRAETLAVAFEIGVLLALYADVVNRSVSKGQDLTYLHFYIDNSLEPNTELASNVVVNCAFDISHIWFPVFEAVILQTLSCLLSVEDRQDLFRSSLFRELRVFTSLITFLFVKVIQDVSYLILLGPAADTKLQGVVIVDFILCLVHLCYVRGHAMTLEDDSRGLDEINIASLILPLVFAIAFAFAGVWLSLVFWLSSCCRCYEYCRGCWSYDDEEDENDVETGGAVS